MAGFLLSCSFLEGNHWKWEWSIAILLYYEFSIWHLYIRMLSYYKCVPTQTTKARLISKKRPTTSSRRAVFWFENTQTTSTKNGWNNKNHSKTKRSENKTMVGWISSNISSHHIQHQPSTHENTPCDPAPPQDTPTGRNLMTRHDGDFLTTRSGSLKNVTIPLKRVVFFSEIHGLKKNLNRSMFSLLYPKQNPWSFAATRKKQLKVFIHFFNLDPENSRSFVIQATGPPGVFPHFPWKLFLEVAGR